MMPPPVANKPCTKPPTEQQLLAFIKRLRYDEDPKELLTSIPTFDESELGNVEEEPEEQHVSHVRRGKGKGHMCISKREVNVSNKPKKAFVPRKPRTITVAENIVEQEAVAVKLVKSVSIEEQRLQQRQIMTQLTIEKQVKKDIDDGAAERGLKLKGATPEDPAVQSLIALRKGYKESIRKHDDDDDDNEDSDMDISEIGSDKGDDDAAGFGVFVYNKSQELPKFIPFSPIVTCSSMKDYTNLLNDPSEQELTDLLSASKVPLGTNVDVQATEFVLHEMIADDVDHHISSPPVTTTHDLVTNPQQSSIQEKAKKLMAKTKQKKRKSIFKQEVEQNFKEYDQKLEALSSINVPKAMEEAVQAKVLTEKKKQLHTHVPSAIAKCVKPCLNNTVLEVMKYNQINLFTTPSSTTADDLSEMDLKLKLLNKMYKSKYFQSHDTHHKLYDLLYESIYVDQESLDAHDTEPSFKKRPHDHQDPPNDREGEKRKKRRKDACEPSSRSSKKDKAPMDSIQ
ncbi:hypothetical protein Tco_1438733 [Tanacetum coccineum]